MVYFLAMTFYQSSVKALGGGKKKRKFDFKKKYDEAFGYGEYEREGKDPYYVDGVPEFEGDYKVYFDCYKYGKYDNKAKLRLWYDRNGDGEYSGKKELIGKSKKKLDKQCAEYCHDLEYGSLTIRYDTVKYYAKGKYQKAKYKEAYKDGEDGYGYKKAYKKVKKYDDYGDKYYVKKYYKKYYKEQLDYAKINLKAYYYKENVGEYEDYGYHGEDGGNEYDYDKKACKTYFIVKKDRYLDNFADAMGI